MTIYTMILVIHFMRVIYRSALGIIVTCLYVINGVQRIASVTIVVLHVKYATVGQQLLNNLVVLCYCVNSSCTACEARCEINKVAS